MKKIFVLMMALVLTIALAGCNANKTDNEVNNTVDNQDATDEMEQGTEGEESDELDNSVEETEGEQEDSSGDAEEDTSSEEDSSSEEDDSSGEDAEDEEASNDGETEETGPTYAYPFEGIYWGISYNDEGLINEVYYFDGSKCTVTSSWATTVYDYVVTGEFENDYFSGYTLEYYIDGVLSHTAGMPWDGECICIFQDFGFEGGYYPGIIVEGPDSFDIVTE